LSSRFFEKRILPHLGERNRNHRHLILPECILTHFLDLKSGGQDLLDHPTPGPDPDAFLNKPVSKEELLREVAFRLAQSLASPR